MTAGAIVVIGHVDHGKTALVQTLTGIDTDRLAEEKARGLSIVAGYAHRRYTCGTVDFVDAPGHGDFVQAMISAVSGTRAALVVIAATEGIAAQTREHLAIARLMGVTDAVVAVTKVDLLPPKAVAAHLDAIRAGLASGPFARAPVVACSSVSGEGIEALHDAIKTMLQQEPPGSGPPCAFLPVDRVFTLPGRGTIVTGTLSGGGVSVGDALRLQPGGREVTLRGLHSRDRARDRIAPGGRTAANLRGVSPEEIPRGAVLCDPAAGNAATTIDVALHILPEAPEVKHMQEVRLHVGTASVVGQLRLYGGGRLVPGADGFAQLRFRLPVMTYAGQHGILRRLSPAETLGGAVVLDPRAPQVRAGNEARADVLRAAWTGEIAGIADALVTAGGGAADLADVARLARCAESDPQALPEREFPRIAPGRITTHRAFSERRSAVCATLADIHASHPARSGVPLATFAARGAAPDLVDHVAQNLVSDGLCRRNARGLTLATHDPEAALPPADRERLDGLEAQFRTAGLSPPDADSVLRDDSDRELLALLIDLGRLVPLANIALKRTVMLHADTLQAAAADLQATFADAGPFPTGAARDALGTSRRVIVPVLEHFDTLGVTARDGDLRRVIAAYPVSPGKRAR
ncbi:hypothetical protein BOO69_10985 [Sulfitobacter alexandrii]|uniref:Tr-type G domain-containing protein n=1 Tax=Sulfitobacter alexandrii TaxID=1917485 RepID=A0A1J0WHS3_9RHOB|nr:selenocysteine-specific translation elongation factor [Sulfitobacter alexandrii]APE43873.1 hypothetical protein BOO69_10985 [Sulfitobacter alexandrii]